MAKVCEICGKKPVVLKAVTRKGKAKYLGGVGKKTTGIVKVRRYPNLQVAKVYRGGQRVTMRVCAQCIRVGRTLHA